MTLNRGYNPDGSQYIQYYGTVDLSPAGATMGSYWEVDPTWSVESGIPIAAAIRNYSAWGASVTAQDAALLTDPVVVDYQYAYVQSMYLNFTDISGPQYSTYTHTFDADISVTIGAETHYLGWSGPSSFGIADDAVWDALLAGQGVQFNVTPNMDAGRYYIMATYGEYAAASLEVYFSAEIPAVPEPSAFALLMGLGGLAAAGWRRRFRGH